MMEAVEVQEEILEEPQEDDVLLASYVLAEIGSASTVVSLYDVFNGSFQLVARGSSLTTSGPPWSDSVHGLHAAVQQVSDLSRRRLINDSNVLIRPTRPNGTGFDYLGTLMSAAPPIRTVVVGLMDEVSVASGRRALNTIYSEEIDNFNLSDKRSRQEQVAALVNLQPDLVFITGGTNGGAARQLMMLVDTVAIGIKLIDPKKRPVVIFAGNEEIQTEVEDKFADATDVYLIDNVRPELESEYLDQAIGLLGDLYVTVQSAKLPNAEYLLQRNDLPVLPVVHGFGALCEFAAALSEGRVLGVDIGQSSLSLISAESDYVNLDVSSDLGLGKANSTLLDHGSIDDIAAWAGKPKSPDMVADFIQNKAVWPTAVPLTTKEMKIEQAIVWANLTLAASRAVERWNWNKEKALSPIRTLLLRGSALVNATNWRRLALLLLDSIQPTGVFNIIADRPGILPSLGLLASYNPHLVVQLYDSVAKDNLGWVIAPVSGAQVDQLVLKLTVEIDNKPIQQLEVLQGEFRVLPLGGDQKAKLTIGPEPDTDIGGGAGKGLTLTVNGGPIGIMIDARGRPRPEFTDNKTKLRLIQKWLKAADN